MPDTAKPTQKVTKKLLVVEDDGEIALVLDMVLNKENMQLDYANNLIAAHEYLQQQQPHLILLDNKLPDGFGVDFISYIKKKFPAIKIIMISGLPAARDVALANGANLFFEKPFSLDEISAAIDSLTD